MSVHTPPGSIDRESSQLAWFEGAGTFE